MACLLLMALSATAAFGQEIKVREPKSSDGELKWKFTAGQSFKIVTDQTSEMAMNLAGQQMDSKSVTVTESTLNIEKVASDGTATANSSIDRMKMSSDSPMMPMDFDSSSDKNTGPLKDMLGPMIGKPISQTIAPNGKVDDIEFSEDMLEGLNSSGDPVMGSMFSESTLTEMVKRATMEFPDDVKVGKEWEQDMELEMGPMTVSTKTKYTYLGVTDTANGPRHLIRGDVTLTFPEEIQGAAIEVAEQDATAYFYFDGVKGFMDRSTMEQKMVMEISAGGQEIEQEMNQKVVTEITVAK
jgi:hypothetical protein